MSDTNFLLVIIILILLSPVLIPLLMFGGFISLIVFGKSLEESPRVAGEVKPSIYETIAGDAPIQEPDRSLEVAAENALNECESRLRLDGDRRELLERIVTRWPNTAGGKRANLLLAEMK